jgi:predicted ATPase/class 3 adenylate cyclase
VLFTDIESSTTRWERYPEEMSGALETHDRILTGCFEHVGARVLKHTGDGLVVVGDDPRQMVIAACRAQAEIAATDWSAVGGLRVRMGLHEGLFHERGGDFFGPDMNMAARVADGGTGGQVVATASTLATIGAPAGCRFEHLGRFRFKGVADPVEVMEVCYEGRPSDVGPYRSARVDAGNLPTPTVELIGRVAERERLSVTLEHPGLVSLTGPGGVGKTTLALSVAAGSAAAFPDGRWFIDLSGATTRDEILGRIATTAELQTSAGSQLDETVAAWIAGQSMLLILDNAEHVIEPVREVCRSVVHAGMQSTLLVTSREPVGLPAERVIEVGTLSTESIRGSAVEMFLTCARSVEPGFGATDIDHRSVLRLCRELDGLPLAIELAAARIPVMSVDQIIDNLRDRFRLLDRGAPTRGRTLEATIAWSYDLLDGGEQATLRALSLFEGAFGVQHAAVLTGRDLIETADTLHSLCQKSVLRRTVGTDTMPPMFHLLESIREYASERLAEHETTAEVADRAATAVTEMIREVGDGWNGARQQRHFDRLNASMPLVRIGLARLAESEPGTALELIVATHQYWLSVGSRQEAMTWIIDAVNRAEATDSLEPGLITRALADAATFAVYCADNRQSVELAERSIELSRSVGQPERPHAVLRLANAALLRVDMAAVGRHCRRALEVYDEHQDPGDPPETLAAIGCGLALSGDQRAGIELCDRAIREHRRHGPLTQASDLVNLGFACQSVDPSRSVDAFMQARQLAEECSAPFYRVLADLGASFGSRLLHDDAAALRHAADGLEVATRIGMRNEALTLLRLAATVLSERGSVDGRLIRLVLDRVTGGPTAVADEVVPVELLALDIGASSDDTEGRDEVAELARRMGFDEVVELVLAAADTSSRT